MAQIKARSSDEIEFVKRVDALAKVLGTTRVALSGKLFNDGKKIDRMADGGGVYHDVFIRAKADLAEMERGVTA